MNHDPKPYLAMPSAELVAAYVSYRRSYYGYGSDRDFDRQQKRLIEDVAKERGLIEYLVKAVALMKEPGMHLKTAAEIAALVSRGGITWPES